VLALSFSRRLQCVETVFCTHRYSDHTHGRNGKKQMREGK
jgi:hypothetical protein